MSTRIPTTRRIPNGQRWLLLIGTGLVFWWGSNSQLHASCGDYLAHVAQSPDSSPMQATADRSQITVHNTLRDMRPDTTEFPCIRCGGHLPTPASQDGVSSSDSRVAVAYQGRDLLGVASEPLSSGQIQARLHFGFPEEVERPPRRISAA